MAYPKFLHGPSLTWRVVQNEAEEADAFEAGFRVWDKMNPTGTVTAVVVSPSDTAPKRRGRPKKTQEQP